MADEKSTDVTGGGISIRELQDSDWPSVWAILEPVFRSGETYAVDVDIAEPAARSMWFESPTAAHVAVDTKDASIVGAYYLKPNQPGPGSHVCNCGYVTAGHAQGRGVASLMCAHSLDAALRLGFAAMQYNCVVATNERAVGLWKKYGFEIIGTLPKAYRHAKLGFVDAHVMYRWLG